MRISSKLKEAWAFVVNLAVGAFLVFGVTLVGGFVAFLSWVDW